MPCFWFEQQRAKCHRCGKDRELKVGDFVRTTDEYTCARLSKDNFGGKVLHVEEVNGKNVLTVCTPAGKVFIAAFHCELADTPRCYR